jgi:GalNAc-alpha-(1->4)-GalNAc-alpha-(1->3)-diNAcBac-PP-undecaprenol alpha-1,4-N-acetyl-D-galactosaminyltransferase
MKIVFVINCFSDGGAERVASILSGCWSNTNDVTAVFTSPKSKNSFPINQNVKLLWLPESTEKRPINKIFRLHQILKKIKPNIVVSFLEPAEFYAFLACRHIDCRLVTSERNDPKQEPRKKIFRFLRWITYRHSNAIVFQTKDAMDYFKKGITKKGIIIPNPVMLNSTKRPAIEQVTKKFIAIGRLDDQKNFALLIRAFSKSNAVLKGYTLSIFGKGPQQDELTKLSQELSLSDKVFFLGFSKEPQKEIASSTALILSSKYEGIPNALLEASSIGVPWIASDCPVGGARLIQETIKTGILFQNGSEVQLAMAINEMINKYPSFYQSSLEGKAKCQAAFDSNKISNQWIELFKSLSNGELER